MSHVLVIAEAGVNHNGSIDRACELVDVAARSGADLVKFQTFRADAVVTATAPKAAYQERQTGGGAQIDMLRALELDEAAHRRLIAHCAERGIGFLSTPFDEASVDLLVGLGLKLLKVPSGELTNGPLLLHLARTGLPVIVSTGMATLAEVEAALGVLAFGYTAAATEPPSEAAFAAARAGSAGRAALAERVTLLHCTTEYPAPVADVNLRAMDTLATSFGLPVGYSDHTPGIAVPVAAVARGATVVEKHFTLDRNLPGPDHKASLEPAELAAMVAGIRTVEAALGSPVKAPAPSERANIAIARRSLVALRAIRRGETLAEDAIGARRPGTGISPMRRWAVVGRRAACDIAAGTVLDEAMLA
jgi:N-acetylneuraminate synthase